MNATDRDGYQAAIYQTFWAVIKDGLKPIFEEFPKETLPLCSFELCSSNLVNNWT
jgi:hypothetical protein